MKIIIELTGKKSRLTKWFQYCKIGKVKYNGDVEIKLWPKTNQELKGVLKVFLQFAKFDEDVE